MNCTVAPMRRAPHIARSAGLRRLGGLPIDGPWQRGYAIVNNLLGKENREPSPHFYAGDVSRRINI
jgi:hypothetical protein